MSAAMTDDLRARVLAQYIKLDKGDGAPGGSHQCVGDDWYAPKWGCATLEHILDAVAEAGEPEGLREAAQEAVRVTRHPKAGTWDIKKAIDALDAALSASPGVPDVVKERDWSKIRDYMDCLGDTGEEKKLRIRWVREMKAENAALRAALSRLGGGES